MKKLLLLLAILFTSAFAQTQLTDIFDAYDDAKSQNKRVMIMLTMEGCPGCEYMKSVVFENSDVAKRLKNDFIVVELDVRADSVPEKLEYFATPTFYFLDANEKILKRLNGGENAKDFLATLKEMKKK